METYREKLKIHNLFLGLGCLVLLAFAAAAIASEFAGWNLLPPVTGDAHWRSRWYGYITGASTGLLGCMGAYLIRNLRALKDEKKLKKLYVKEHDERTIQIWTCARNSAMQVLLILGLVASVAAGYFSISVATTILLCTLVGSLVSMGFAVCYSKQF